ncbi:MAG: helix-turn-helix transcriptional regulator [Bacillota bacterium]|nr:helix-turn-helix transcriptional regulator [Bacillota bacterium]
MELIVGGATNAEIAAKLYISENTVKAHIKNINRKLGVANKYELLAALIKAQAEPSSRTNG